MKTFDDLTTRQQKILRKKAMNLLCEGLFLAKIPILPGLVINKKNDKYTIRSLNDNDFMGIISFNIWTPQHQREILEKAINCAFSEYEAQDDNKLEKTLFLCYYRFHPQNEGGEMRRRDHVERGRPRIDEFVIPMPEMTPILNTIEFNPLRNQTTGGGDNNDNI